MIVPVKIAALFNLLQGTKLLYNASHCEYLVKYLTKFHSHITSNKEKYPWITPAELELLSDGLQSLLSTSRKRVVWMAECSCAVLIC